MQSNPPTPIGPILSSSAAAADLGAARAAPRAQPAATPSPRWTSEHLLAGAEEATITHGDQVYRLRRTLTGKLILTK